MPAQTTAFDTVSWFPVGTEAIAAVPIGFQRLGVTSVAGGD